MNNMTRLKVKDHPNLHRDPQSNGIINADVEAYKNHLKRKQIQKQKQLDEMNSQHRLNTIESEVKELKSNIAKILEILQNAKS